MTKRILALFLFACLCLSFATTAFAAEIKDSIPASASDEEYMSLTIFQNSGIRITPTASYTILDISGNPTYVCVEFIHSGAVRGFGLIDLTTYSVTMFALDAIVPFDSNNVIVSDGVLNFAVVDIGTNTATDTRTNEVISLNTLLDNSRVGLPIIPPEQRTAIVNRLKSAEGAMQTRSVSTILVPGGSDETLVYSSGQNSGSWATGCGINAVAMYLRHMDEYFDSSYVSSSHTSESKLKSALASLAYAEWNITRLISMDRLATLTNLYTDKYGGSSTTDVSKTSYSWTSYKTRINNGNGKPCILYIGEGKVSYWGPAHAVVGVGYTSGATSTSGYVIVNSGWTSLKYVQIATSIPGSIIK